MSAAEGLLSFRLDEFFVFEFSPSGGGSAHRSPARRRMPAPELGVSPFAGDARGAGAAGIGPGALGDLSGYWRRAEGESVTCPGRLRRTPAGR